MNHNTSFCVSSCAFTARVHSTPHRPFLNLTNHITSFYGSSCANNGKGALNTPEALPQPY